MGLFSVSLFLIEVIIISIVVQGYLCCLAEKYMSALGDPKMRSPNARFGWEAWNSCNEVGREAPNMGSPRLADCTDLNCISSLSSDSSSGCGISRKVTESDNKLKTGDRFPNSTLINYNDSDRYASEKELYLGLLCEVFKPPEPAWSFWKIMLKNGNLDKNKTLCLENGQKLNTTSTVTDRKFPCFGEGCMNPPLVYHNESKLDSKSSSLFGGFYGTYDLDANVGDSDTSFFSVTWHKNSSTNSWIVSHELTTSTKYPWLMLYLRADANFGFNGGYHYYGSGIMKKLPESPNFKVTLTLDIKQGGGPSSQFYLLDIGSCWKNNGEHCDGDVHTDVTRYSEMIINPSTANGCRPDNHASCPTYHISSTTNEKIHRSNTSSFPYSAYHYYCAPGNARYLEEPFGRCDPYSNPQAQELVQLLPHPEWAVYGYPGKKVDDWEAGPRTWELDTGLLSDRLYFYQDPGSPVARRVWTSINVGTEIYDSPTGVTAEWSVSDFDVLVPIS